MMIGEKSKNFYIFRHGECPFNVSGHMQGQKFDGRLTERGVAQAHTVGLKLKNKHIELIVSSPLSRARQTAKIVKSYVHAPILVDRRFIEVNLGIAEGLHITTVEKEYGELYERWRNCPLEDTTTRFEGGESKAEVRTRIFAGLNHYAKDSDFHNIAVSGHGITISQTLLFFGKRVSNIPNGSIIHLTYQHPDWSYQGFVEQ